MRARGASTPLHKTFFVMLRASGASMPLSGTRCREFESASSKVPRHAADELRLSGGRFSDLASVSTSPRLASAATIASACRDSEPICASRAASSARTVVLSDAYTGSSMVTLTVSTTPSLHDSTKPARGMDEATRRQTARRAVDGRSLLNDSCRSASLNGERSPSTEHPSFCVPHRLSPAAPLPRNPRKAPASA